MKKSEFINELKSCDLHPAFSFCRDLYITNSSDEYIYYDNLIDVELDGNKRFKYINNEFTFDNKAFFDSNVLDLPYDILFEPIDNFLELFRMNIDEGYVLRISNNNETKILMLHRYDFKKQIFFGKIYSQNNQVKEIDINYNEIDKFIHNNSFCHKMHFVKKVSNTLYVSMLHMKIQLEYYILKEREENALLGINVFKKLDYSKKENRLLVAEHKLLMMNRIEYLVECKGLSFSSEYSVHFDQYCKSVTGLFENDLLAINKEMLINLIALEKKIISYISDFYKEHD